MKCQPREVLCCHQIGNLDDGTPTVVETPVERRSDDGVGSGVRWFAVKSQP